MKSAQVSPKKGFTLIEIIMTIVLLGVISVALGLYVAQQVQAVARVDEYTLALNLARREMEIVNNLAYASIATATISNYDGYAGFSMDRTVTVVPPPGGAEELKQVLVQIKRPGGTENLATLVTYIANKVSFGS